MKIITEFLQKTKMHIYVDLDGVLTDFDNAVIELGHGTSEQIENKDKNLMWKLIHKKGISFWSEMKWMPDGKKLWEFVKRFKPTILSAQLAGDVNSIKGKQIWIKKYLGYVPSIICLRKEKQNYANENSILIDDKEKNILEWTEKNGIGILHTNSKDTIIKLKKIFK